MTHVANSVRCLLYACQSDIPPLGSGGTRKRRSTGAQDNVIGDCRNRRIFTLLVYDEHFYTRGSYSLYTRRWHHKCIVCHILWHNAEHSPIYGYSELDFRSNRIVSHVFVPYQEWGDGERRHWAALNRIRMWTNRFRVSLFYYFRFFYSVHIWKKDGSSGADVSIHPFIYRWKRAISSRHAPCSPSTGGIEKLGAPI